MGWGGEGDVDGDTLWDPALSQRLLFETALSQRLKSLRSPAPVSGVLLHALSQRLVHAVRCPSAPGLFIVS